MIIMCPWYHWWMGTIEELLFEKDGLVWGVKVKAISKAILPATWYCPVQKIIPFKINEETKIDNENNKSNYTKNDREK